MSEFDRKSFLKHLTSRPGVYRMFGEDGKVLYVGKAKNLKNRVSSYFRSTALDGKTMALVTVPSLWPIFATSALVLPSSAVALK